MKACGQSSCYRKVLQVFQPLAPPNFFSYYLKFYGRDEKKKGAAVNCNPSFLI
jgi:hypothetical protein